MKFIGLPIDSSLNCFEYFELASPFIEFLFLAVQNTAFAQNLLIVFYKSRIFSDLQLRIAFPCFCFAFKVDSQHLPTMASLSYVELFVAESYRNCSNIMAWFGR